MGLFSELHEVRVAAVLGALRHSGATSVMDLGCGSGTLLVGLLAEPTYLRILGMDSSGIAVQEIRRQPQVAPAETEGRLELVVGSYRSYDKRLDGFDAATLVETIEHLDPGHLSQAEQTVFARYRPATVVVTTPNVEFNPLYGLEPGQLRDPDHRFEWTRTKFRQWAHGVGNRHGYRSRFGAIGELHPDLGAPTQMAVFERVAPPA